MSVAATKILVFSVVQGDVEKVCKSLSLGADVHVRTEKDQNTLLHDVSSPDVANILVLNGADVNAVNIDGESPLHAAITRRKELPLVESLINLGADVNIKNNHGQTPLHLAVTDRNGLAVSVVRQLLKHGANVNATDAKGNTVLFLAVKYYKDLEVIKELLKFEADINRRSSSLNCFCTPIDVAVHDSDPSYAQLLIKISVIKNYHNDYRKITDLESYIKFANKKILSCFFYNCVSEIVNMKTDKFSNNCSLYDYVLKYDIIKPLYCDIKKIKKILENYCIYNDIVLTSIKPCVQRADFLGRIRGLQVYMDLDLFNKHASEKRSLINGDCLYKIGEFLSNEDLFNFLTVIDKKFDQPFDYLDKYL